MLSLLSQEVHAPAHSRPPSRSPRCLLPWMHAPLACLDIRKSGHFISVDQRWITSKDGRSAREGRCGFRRQPAAPSQVGEAVDLFIQPAPRAVATGVWGLPGAGGMSVAAHQQPDVNYIQVLEKVDFPCAVKAQHLPFKGNQLRAETGSIGHSGGWW